MAEMTVQKPLAVTIGDPAGIGAEVILKSWLFRREKELPPFIVVGDPEHLKQTAQHLGLDVPIAVCAIQEAAGKFHVALPVLALSGAMASQFGMPAKQDGNLVCEAITTAVGLALSGEVCGVVTAPINKKALYDSGFAYPGHTEFLAALAGAETGNSVQPVMMLAGPQLRTVPATIHIPLKEVPARLSETLIVSIGKILAEDLTRYFGLARPRIAVSGLNPHAGEEGSMGSEDEAVIAPAIRTLKNAGIDAVGPLPGDTMFHEAARKTYDAALCMYHDQALIPAKTLGFDDAVNVTLGLPFIRTSPDHGTAYNIAGKGIANPSSMIAAIAMAGEMASNMKRSTDTQGSGGSKN